MDDPTPTPDPRPVPILDEPSLRKVYWRPDRLVVLADGKAWALPFVDEAMLEYSPKFEGVIRQLCALAEANSRFAGSLAGSPPSPEIVRKLFNRLAGHRCNLLVIAVALLSENYSFPGDRDALDLIPDIGPTFEDFQAALLECCSIAIPPPGDLEPSELDEAESIFLCSENPHGLRG